MRFTIWENRRAERKNFFPVLIVKQKPNAQWTAAQE